jgi:prefoldin subunit 5
MTQLFKIMPRSKSVTVDEAIERITDKINQLSEVHQTGGLHKLAKALIYERISAFEEAVDIINGYSK